MRRSYRGSVNRSGFTLVELLVVIAIIGILIALLLPAVQAARESARRSQCVNNLKQVGIALNNFHDVRKHLPTAGYEPVFADDKGAWPGARTRWSFLVALLPYVEQQALYDAFMNVEVNAIGGPLVAKSNPWTTQAWSLPKPFVQTRVPIYICPSEGQATYVEDDGTLVPNSYHGNRGDYWLDNFWYECRGVFGGRGDKTVVSYRMVKDGTSNTAAVSECKIGRSKNKEVSVGMATNVGGGNGSPPSLCLAAVGSGNLFTGTVVTNGYLPGYRWADALHVYTQYFHMLPPNGPSCVPGTNAESWALVTSSSFHPGGVNVAMLDGSVRFVNDSIDAGDPAMTVTTSSSYGGGNPQEYMGPSPYGVWGAMGTSRSGDQTLTNP